MSDKKRTSTESTPSSATDREVTRHDDQAVRRAVTAEKGSAGTSSVLPGPPLPPRVQSKLKKQQGAQSTKGNAPMVDPHSIREHMEVVGSDGDHVGTVDHCENDNVIKLTKSDPSAGGQHHFIPMAWVDHVDQQVHLAHPGSEARSRWG